MGMFTWNICLYLHTYVCRTKLNLFKLELSDSLYYSVTRITVKKFSNKIFNQIR